MHISVLYLICFGSLLISVELFLLLRTGDIDQSLKDATCIVEIWVRNIGYVCLYMAIFCKLWRAYKVAQFRKNQIILPKHVIGPFVVMLMAVIAVTITQTILDPPVWQAKVVPGIGNVGLCLPSASYASLIGDRKSNSLINNPYIWIEITEHSLLLLCLTMMLLMAYKARRIPENISDSRKVFQAVFTSVFLSFLMIGLDWVGRQISNMSMLIFARSLRHFFDAILYVGFLVVPKIYIVWREKRIRTGSDVTDGRLPNSILSTSRAESGGGGRVYVRGVDLASGQVQILSGPSGDTPNSL
jgi:hypothetical protein